MEAIGITSLAFQVLFGTSTVLMSAGALIISILAYRNQRKNPPNNF